MHGSLRAISLAELIITIAVLSILIGLAVINFFGHIESSEDSARKSSVQSIVKNLDIFKTTRGNYPNPDAAVSMSYSGTQVYQAGLFGSGVAREMKVFGSDAPLDPAYDIPFYYGVTADQSQYQIATIQGQQAYINGYYNGFLAEVDMGTQRAYILLPSLVSNNLSDTDIIAQIDQNALVYHAHDDVSFQYQPWLDTQSQDLGIDDPVAFVGPVSSLSTSLPDIALHVSDQYGSSSLASEEIYREFLLQNSDGQQASLASLFLKYFNTKL